MSSSGAERPAAAATSGALEGALVIAIGNPLRGDDGVGPAVGALLERDGLRVLTVQELGPELAEEIAAARAVVFVDARAGGTPGEVTVERLQPAASGGASSHALTPEILLAVAERLHGAPPPSALVAVAGRDFELQERLSPDVALTLDRACEASRGFLAGPS